MPLLPVCPCQLSELTAQLSDSLATQQALAKEEARLRVDLNRAQLEVARLNTALRTHAVRPHPSTQE